MHADEIRVEVSVVLLDGGVSDVLDRFMANNPGCVNERSRS